MTVKTGTWIPAIVTAAALAAVLAWQHQTGAHARDQLAALRVAAAKLDALEQQTRTLAASDVSEGELTRLRADHAALIRLRAELDSLRAAARSKAAPAATAEKPAEPLAPAWSVAGCGTPADALRSAVWAMASGDVRPFAARIAVAPNERAQSDAIFGRLPTEVRTQYGTLEAWIASATARTLPIGSLKVVQQTERGPDEVELTVQLHGRRGGSGNVETRSAQLVLLRGSDGWRFVVPLATVQQFAEREAASARARPTS